MKLDFPAGAPTKVVVQAKDRNAMERTLRALRIITGNDNNEARTKLSVTIHQDLSALLASYPDTRKGKKGKKDDPQKRLPGTEEGDPVEKESA